MQELKHMHQGISTGLYLSLNERIASLRNIKSPYFPMHMGNINTETNKELKINFHLNAIGDLENYANMPTMFV